MKRFILLTITICVTSLGVRAQSVDSLKFITITPTGSIKNIDWLEKNTIGQIGFEVKLQPSKKTNITFGTAIFKTIGASLLTPSQAPAFSSVFDNHYGMGVATSSPKTTYNGGFINVDVGIPFKLRDSSNVSVEPFLGLEAKIWGRTTDYGIEGNPLIVEEKYKFLSPSFGAKLNYSTKSKVKLTLRISGSYPIISKLKLDEKNLNLPGAELDLKRQLSPSVEIGAKIKKLTIKLRYERINFGSSDSLRGFSAPASRANVSGVSVSYDF